MLELTEPLFQLMLLNPKDGDFQTHSAEQGSILVLTDGAVRVTISGRNLLTADAGRMASPAA